MKIIERNAKCYVTDGNDELPLGWQRVNLGDLLPPEAFPELDKLVNRQNDIAAFKVFCGKYRDVLLAKQVEPDYLAWVLYGMLAGAGKAGS